MFAICLIFTWGWDILWKRGDNRIRGRLLWNRELRHLLDTSIVGWGNFDAEAVLLFYCFFGENKKNSFQNYSWPVLWCLDYCILLISIVTFRIQKRCTLSLLLICPRGSIGSCSGGEVGTMNRLREWFAWGAGSWRKLDVLLQEACSKPYYISKIKLSTIIVNGFLPWTAFSKSSILDIWQGSEYTSTCPMWVLSVIFSPLISGK